MPADRLVFRASRMTRLCSALVAVLILLGCKRIQGATREQANASFALWIPSCTLKALLIRPGGIPPPQLLEDSNDDSEWLQQAGAFPQRFPNPVQRRNLQEYHSRSVSKE